MAAHREATKGKKRPADTEDVAEAPEVEQKKKSKNSQKASQLVPKPSGTTSNEKVIDLEDDDEPAQPPSPGGPGPRRTFKKTKPKTKRGNKAVPNLFDTPLPEHTGPALPPALEKSWEAPLPQAEKKKKGKTGTNLVMTGHGTALYPKKRDNSVSASEPLPNPFRSASDIVTDQSP